MADAIGDPLRSSLTKPGHLSQHHVYCYEVAILKKKKTGEKKLRGESGLFQFTLARYTVRQCGEAKAKLQLSYPIHCQNQK